MASYEQIEHQLKPGSVVRVLGGEELVMIALQIFDIKIDLERILEKKGAS